MVALKGRRQMKIAKTIVVSICCVVLSIVAAVCSCDSQSASYGKAGRSDASVTSLEEMADMTGVLCGYGGSSDGESEEMYATVVMNEETESFSETSYSSSGSETSSTSSLTQSITAVAGEDAYYYQIDVTRLYERESIVNSETYTVKSFIDASLECYMADSKTLVRFSKLIYRFYDSGDGQGDEGVLAAANHVGEWIDVSSDYDFINNFMYTDDARSISGLYSFIQRSLDGGDYLKKSGDRYEVSEADLAELYGYSDNGDGDSDFFATYYIDLSRSTEPFVFSEYGASASGSGSSPAGGISSSGQAYVRDTKRFANIGNAAINFDADVDALLISDLTEEVS